MDKAEAAEILRQELSRFRTRPQEDLLYLLHNQETFERVGPSKTVYQLEIQADWDDESERELRVTGCIDDKGWLAFYPLCDSFIMRPDGSFVGE